jgi:hypothetical protein
LLQRRILLLSFRVVAGRRPRVNGGEQKVESTTDYWSSWVNYSGGNATSGEVFRGGSPEITELSWWR